MDTFGTEINLVPQKTELVPVAHDCPTETMRNINGPMVELRSVTKRFGAFAAVSEIDLTIRVGEFLTLLGPSGCGKTTLLRMISGFETPSEGTVWLDGEDVTHVPPYHRKRQPGLPKLRALSASHRPGKH